VIVGWQDRVGVDGVIVDKVGVDGVIEQSWVLVA